MRGAWLALLAACGFQSRPQATDPTIDASSIDASGMDASNIDGETLTTLCWMLTGTMSAAVCTTTLADTIDISSDMTLDTSPGASNPQPLTCAPLAEAGLAATDVCALAAKTIRIAANHTLSVHGSRPLALFAHTITIDGTIDVASHGDGRQGPGADPTVCFPGTPPTGDGGGQGGTAAGDGGNGGDVGGTQDRGGAAAASFTVTTVHGGCPGIANGSGDGKGGHGGGALWIAVDTGTLTIGASATINASGASGAGGTAVTGQRGGYGGGSGGLIVLQASKASALVLDPSALIFANGGAGGGGAGTTSDGAKGTDPAGPASAGIAGSVGTTSIGHPGLGGTGFPDPKNGGNADKTGNGGGGGGGGAGTIRLVPHRAINDPDHVSPAPADP